VVGTGPSERGDGCMTHQPFAVRLVHSMRLADDGRALEHWAARDDLGLAIQAGLLPPCRPDGWGPA
ncbi:MAG: hypothetical protein QOE98_2548, partial [Gaiellaceae bacterium]|nr:hypothetical protein [Gaiellaceae bacterium]